MPNMITESEFQATVTGMAKIAGWLAYHEVDSRRSTPGFPDLVLAHPQDQRIFVAELKVPGGRIRPEQVTWLKLFDAALGRAFKVHLWYPKHLDYIQQVIGERDLSRIHTCDCGVCTGEIWRRTMSE